jgi:hypothetical protein
MGQRVLETAPPTGHLFRGKILMETDISFDTTNPVQGEEVDFGGLRRPDPYAPAGESHMEEGSTPIPQPQPHADPPPDYYYYSQPPMLPPEPPEKPDKATDIFSNMDRNTYILLIIAFIFGFFIGRGMIQPIILRSGGG